MNLSDVITGAVIAAMAAPFGYMLGSIIGAQRACHQELVKIRCAAESLHDHVVPVALLKLQERKASR